MKNQVDVGDQNTQQIEQNAIIQPTQNPEKSKVNPWIISTVILFFLLVGTFASSVSKPKTETLDNNVSTITPTGQTTISPTPVSVSSTHDSVLNWKTYTNVFSRYQYSFPYSWKNAGPCPQSEGPNCGGGPHNNSFASKSGSDAYFMVRYDEAGCLSDMTQIKTPFIDAKEREINISGIRGILLEGKSKPEGAILPLELEDGKIYDRTYIRLLKGKECYNIDTWSYQNDNTRNILNQIILTFKLTL